MGVITYFAYNGLYTLYKNNIISLVIAFLLAVVAYAITLLLFKGLSESEIRRFPKGYLIVKIAKKLHLL